MKLASPVTINAPLNDIFGFQKPNSLIMEGIVRFHNDLSVYLIFILGFVITVLYVCITDFSSDKERIRVKKFSHASVLEVVWTLLPAIILISVAIPSFSLLYSLDNVLDTTLTIRGVGHQWYWSYEYLGLNDITKLFLFEKMNDVGGGSLKINVNNLNYDAFSNSFDSYMMQAEDLFKSKVYPPIRLLTVDVHLSVPIKIPIRVLITSEDVLHSWAVPSLGVKVDACPGRLNQAIFAIQREGFIYGQCSEICGVNHSFMPIGIYGYYLPHHENFAIENLAGLHLQTN